MKITHLLLGGAILGGALWLLTRKKRPWAIGDRLRLKDGSVGTITDQRMVTYYPPPLGNKVEALLFILTPPAGQGSPFPLTPELLASAVRL